MATALSSVHRLQAEGVGEKTIYLFQLPIIPTPLIK
jgi:hypothetical protein